IDISIGCIKAISFRNLLLPAEPKGLFIRIRSLPRPFGAVFGVESQFFGKMSTAHALSVL
ncbi:hypothetical protein ABTK02_20035, partial [Acinetobacter baumannii]